jgi:uncharacterized membrane protein (DUF106 family)
VTAKGHGSFYVGNENNLERERGGHTHVVEVVNATELCTLIWLILCDVTFSSIIRGKEEKIWDKIT